MDLYSAECFKNNLTIPLNNNVLRETSFGHNLRVKLSCSGLTYLKEERIFKNRLSGSRSYTVTPHPLLVHNSQLDERGNLCNGSGRPENNKKIRPAGYDSKEVKEPREYRVNKKLIRHRVWNFLLTQDKPILHAITVSFPPCVTDDLGYQALNTWLTVCRQSIHLREYLWVAERQENDTIHYHILIPQYFNVVKANKAMATTLCNMVRKGQLRWHISAAKRYNGVDIAKNRTTKRVTNFALGSSKKALVAYITKYISKNDSPFKHYAWHNSRGFSAMMTSICLTEAEAKYLGIRNYLNMDKAFAGEFAVFIAWQDKPHPFFTDVMRTVNREIYNKGSTDMEALPLKFLLN